MFKKLFGKKPPEPPRPSDPVAEAQATYDALKTRNGAEDPDTLQALFALGQALIGMRRFDEAEAIGTQLREIFEAQSGPDHPNVGYGLDIIATALAGQDRRRDALNVRKRSLALLENHFGPDHEMTLQRARMLAIDHAELGQVSEAKDILARYMPAATTIPPLYAQYMDTTAFVTSTADGPEAAIPILEELIDFYRDHGQDNTDTFASKLFNLSQMYLAADRKLDALNASGEAGMTALETYGPDHPASQDIFAFQTSLREARERGEF